MPGYNLMMLTSPPVWLAKQMLATLKAQDIWTAEDIIFFKEKKTRGLVTEMWLSLRREDIQVETSDSVLAWCWVWGNSAVQGFLSQTPMRAFAPLQLPEGKRGCDTLHGKTAQSGGTKHTLLKPSHFLNHLWMYFHTQWQHNYFKCAPSCLLYQDLQNKGSWAGGCRWERTCPPGPEASAHQLSIFTLAQ